MQFKDQTAIVTGGTRGIGAGIARAFLKEGATVIVTFGSDEESARKFKNDNTEFSDQIDIRQFNVADYGEVEQFYRDIEEKHPKIDILVNNAGIRRDQIVGMMSEEDWDKVMDVNLKGCFSMSKFGVQKMSRQRSGCIVNIASPSGRIGFPGQGNYAASKAGMFAFSRCLALELAKRKVRVNCVSPGFIATDLISDLKDDVKEKYMAMVPLKRFGTPEEIAHAVLFLASPQATYITGTILEVSGGLG